MNSNQVLDREFLEIRAKLLEIGASLDRIDRAAGDVSRDQRMQLIQDAMELIASDSPHRAERIQLLFSRDYDDAWQEKFEMTTPS